MIPKRILVTGGFGYVGARLTPHLLGLGHQVRVLSGVPFGVGLAIEPPGPVPRDPADPALLGLQGHLISELRNAQ